MTSHRRRHRTRPAASARPPPAGWPPRASTWSPPPAAPTGWPSWSPRSPRPAAQATAGDLRRHLRRVGGRAGRGRGRALGTGDRCWSTTPAARTALDPVETGSVADWQWMYDVNVLGTLRVTQALLPGAGGLRRRHHRDDQLHRRADRLRGRRRLRRGQARPDRARRDAAAGAVRPADPGDRDRPGHGADRRVRRWSASAATRSGPPRSTPAWPSRWSPRTSPTASPGAPPARTTSTSTGWWSGRWPRPPSTRCTGSARPRRSVRASRRPVRVRGEVRHRTTSARRRGSPAPGPTAPR